MLTFQGLEEVTLAPGGDVWSDPIEFETTDLDEVAISFHFSGDVVMSLHDRAGRNNYGAPIGSGNNNAQASGGSFRELLPWTYLVSAVDVHTPELTGTVVAYGSSVVDGQGSELYADGTSAAGRYLRWADVLASRVATELPADRQFTVVNAGIGGTTAAAACSQGGLDGESRLERDVLALTGVTGVIYYYGTNDLALGCTSAQIIAAMEGTFQRLHDAGIAVYVTPVTPRSSYNAQQNGHRAAINEWIRAGGDCSGRCDGVLDFDEVLRDPANHQSLLPAYDVGDTVHANVEGQQAIAESIDLSLFLPEPGTDPTPEPTPEPPPNPTVTVTALPTATATATATTTATATASTTVTATATTTVTAPPSSGGGNPLYVTPGLHRSGGRLWSTTCEPYSTTTRCRTEIWATTTVLDSGAFVTTTEWVFNNLTYLPSERSRWAENPLGRPGHWASTDGRDWYTECDTANTGRGGCRSYIRTSVVERVPGTPEYRVVSKFVFNNMVLFS